MKPAIALIPLFSFLITLVVSVSSMAAEAQNFVGVWMLESCDSDVDFSPRIEVIAQGGGVYELRRFFSPRNKNRGWAQSIFSDARSVETTRKMVEPLHGYDVIATEQTAIEPATLVVSSRFEIYTSPAKATEKSPDVITLAETYYEIGDKGDTLTVSRHGRTEELKGKQPGTSDSAEFEWSCRYSKRQ